jgi:RNA polymerase sigma factor (sigma-70 family)
MTQMAELQDKMFMNIFDQELMPQADALLTFAMRYTSDYARAEDLVQETYLKAWRSIGSFQSGSNAKAWLCTILKHLFINEYRSLKNQPRKVDFEDIVTYHNEDEPSNPRYSDLYNENHTQSMGDEIAEAINGLKDIYRLVVLLDLQGFTYAEIAAIAGIKLNTVRSRLNRGRAELAITLREYAKTSGYRITDRAQLHLCGTSSID